MLRISWSKWFLIQIGLGVPLVVVPIFLKGAVSLTVTIPIYLLIVALTQRREMLERMHSRRLALMSQLRCVVSHLQKLTQGAHGISVWAILQDLLGHQDFHAQVVFTGNAQAGDLLSSDCEQIFNGMSKLQYRVERCTNECPDSELEEIVYKLRQFILEYRRLVHNFLRFLKETKANGTPVQYLAPFSLRVHDDLADDYDRLVDDARQLGRQLKNVVGMDFLEDKHLTRFRRATILR